MLTMTTVTRRPMKRYSLERNFPFPLSKNNIKRLRNCSSKQHWSVEYRKTSEQICDKAHCQVYLKFFPSTLKCSIDVIVKSSNQTLDDYDDHDSILIGQTRIAKTIRPGVIRIRLVSSLFGADTDVHEDSSLIKLETIPNPSYSNHFDKQFAVVLKNTRIGPGVIGKLFVESLDPSNGSYTSNPPIFELNLNLASEHEILLTSSSSSSHQKTSDNLIHSPLQCGCILSSDQSHSMISDKCNLILSDMKLIHRLSDPLRCLWKSLGRELSPPFFESDLNDLNQRYFLTEGNYECTYQLLREWYIRDPHQANIRYLLTRLKLPFHLIETIHNDIVRTFSSV